MRERPPDGRALTPRPPERAAMYLGGTAGTVLPSVLIPGYAWRPGVHGARGFFIGANL